MPEIAENVVPATENVSKTNNELFALPAIAQTSPLDFSFDWPTSPLALNPAFSPLSTSHTLMHDEAQGITQNAPIVSKTKGNSEMAPSQRIVGFYEALDVIS